jgi:hypothetical protein
LFYFFAFPCFKSENLLNQIADDSNASKVGKSGAERFMRPAFQVSHSGRLPWSSPSHAVRKILAPLIGKARRVQASTLYLKVSNTQYF